MNDLGNVVVAVMHIYCYVLAAVGVIVVDAAILCSCCCCCCCFVLCPSVGVVVDVVVAVELLLRLFCALLV